jgi:uncharacterized protein Usg
VRAPTLTSCNCTEPGATFIFAKEGKLALDLFSANNMKSMNNPLLLLLRTAGEAETIAESRHDGGQHGLSRFSPPARRFRFDNRQYSLADARSSGILQSYVWQFYDLHPHFPELRKFLDFWSRELDGLLHSVTVAHADLIKPAEFKAVSREFDLH